MFKHKDMKKDMGKKMPDHDMDEAMDTAYPSQEGNGPKAKKFSQMAKRENDKRRTL